jgi:hypothetical protein
MTSVLEAITTDGKVVISFPESAMSPEVRDDFIATLKMEWAARQSLMTVETAKRLAEEVDSGWWQSNRDKILRSIGES